MNKVILSIFFVGMLFVIGCTSGNNQNTENQNVDLQQNNNQQNTNVDNQDIETAQSIKISVSELNGHDGSSDCWVVYKNKVYDVTAIIPNHPGGPEKISQYCGTTGFESAFTNQHGDSKVENLLKYSTYKGDLEA